MLTLPDPPEANDRSSNVWNVREVLLDTGRSAALQLKQWQVCLDLIDEIVRTEEARGAPVLERAKTRFNKYGPLLRLRRFCEAWAVLEACLQTFRLENAKYELGLAYCALADLEHQLGRYEEACRFEETSFRYAYTVWSSKGVANSHLNYAS